jgi:7,8-dihydropterin-6-yl-methyl-4-(beta-D-ribofuranosyl)aminobenzene 5'-phosphate synthase
VPPARATISVLYDNVSWREGMQTAWGYACLVQIRETSILFDTGGDGGLLLANMAGLGVQPAAVDVVVLSHAHADHTGGLAELLAAGVRPVVYLPASFPEAIKRQVADQGHLVEVSGPIEVAPGVYSTGEVGSEIAEQALAVRTAEGGVVITGCAHPGVVTMARVAQQVVGGEIALVMGGFHLEDATAAEIESTMQGLRALGVQRVAPSHCTGNFARQLLAEEFGDAYLRAGAGWSIVLDLPPDS